MVPCRATGELFLWACSEPVDGGVQSHFSFRSSVHEKSSITAVSIRSLSPGFYPTAFGMYSHQRVVAAA